MKVCVDCNIEKPLDSYYKHKEMADGHLRKCKECVKGRVGKYRERNIDSIRAYDRARGNRQTKEYHDRYRIEQKIKYQAHYLVSNAIRDKRLFRKPCEICGEKYVHGHHDDYNKPLEVRWLCPVHHRQWHIKNGSGKT